MSKIQWYVKDLQMEGAATLTGISENRTKAVYDLADGGSIVIIGEKLKADPGNPGELGSGTVERVVFKNEDGSLGMTVVGKYDAAAIGDAATANGAYGIYYDVLFEGNDRIFGSGHGQSIWGGLGDDEIHAGGGKDIIFGQAGNDKMWGGKGADSFLFYDEPGGRDVIRDLDIKGKDADTLYISSDVAVLSIKSANGGDDTRLELDTGGTILIKDVTRAQFIDYWDVT
jgi:Ca2+-binding RTX toxin-like protein